MACFTMEPRVRFHCETSQVNESGEPQDFNAARWFAKWIEQPLPALANAKPSDYLDTLTGQRLVSSLLAKIQSGAYA